jgi:hypothetical protein
VIEPPGDGLEELLFGADKKRADAPEPGLLVELAKLIPDDAIHYALMAVAGVAPPGKPRLPARSWLRQRVLRALAARIADDPERFLAGDWQEHILPELAPFLPREFHARALELIERLGEPHLQAVALAGLAAGIDEPGAHDELLKRARKIALGEGNPVQELTLSAIADVLAPPERDSPDVSPETSQVAARAGEYLATLSEHERYYFFYSLLVRMADPLGGMGSRGRARAADEVEFGLEGDDVAKEEYRGGGGWGSEPAYAGEGPMEPSLPGEADVSYPEREDEEMGGVPTDRPIATPRSRLSGLAEPSAERVVNTGFAPAHEPGELQSPSLPLERSRDYWFCLEIGKALPQSAEPDQTLLPTEYLPSTARLVVALFAFPGELELSPTADVGELKLDERGRVTVARGAGVPPGVATARRKRRLFFPVRTPSHSGHYRLRCNIYCEGVLVQSRLVRARVMRSPRESPAAVRTQLEYTLSRAIRPAQLASFAPHKLSLMLNGDDGTHQLRVFADDGKLRVKTDPSFDASELTTLIDNARAALRQVAWGDINEWRKGKEFRYGASKRIELDRLRPDLARLAIEGYNIYRAITRTLRASRSLQEKSFADLMAEPGYVQLASQKGSMLVPLSVVYDYSPFDDTADLADYSLCDVFLQAIEEGAPLEELSCLDGRCPHRGEDLVVCPSGFWGFRHYLGLPLSATVDVPPVLGPKGMRSLVFGSATGLDQVAAHEAVLKAYATSFASGHSRRELLRLLADTPAQIVYLYCHGGLDRTRPFLLVGAGKDGPMTPAYLYDRVQWSEWRPLVFINGCHTTAVRPDQAFELVSAFVEDANAAGVIGTEITVVESIARAFGEEFIRRFTSGSETVGKAVRNTRLKLLEQGNPLGLVYIPFVLAGLAIDAETLAA